MPQAENIWLPLLRCCEPRSCRAGAGCGAAAIIREGAGDERGSDRGTGVPAAGEDPLRTITEAASAFRRRFHLTQRSCPLSGWFHSTAASPPAPQPHSTQDKDEAEKRLARLQMEHKELTQRFLESKKREAERMNELNKLHDEANARSTAAALVAAADTLPTPNPALLMASAGESSEILRSVNGDALAAAADDDDEKGELLTTLSAGVRRVLVRRRRRLRSQGRRGTSSGRRRCGPDIEATPMSEPPHPCCLREDPQPAGLLAHSLRFSPA